MDKPHSSVLAGSEQVSDGLEGQPAGMRAEGGDAAFAACLLQHSRGSSVHMLRPEKLLNGGIHTEIVQVNCTISAGQPYRRGIRAPRELTAD